MKKINIKVSSMQIEAWRMKDKVYRDTKGMGSASYFRYIADKSHKILRFLKNHSSVGSKNTSPLDVRSIRTKATTADIINSVRESRQQ